jgi:hypothetical protein
MPRQVDQRRRANKPVVFGQADCLGPVPGTDDARHRRSRTVSPANFRGPRPKGLSICGTSPGLRRGGRCWTVAYTVDPRDPPPGGIHPRGVVLSPVPALTPLRPHPLSINGLRNFRNVWASPLTSAFAGKPRGQILRINDCLAVDLPSAILSQERVQLVFRRGKLI